MANIKLEPTRVKGILPREDTLRSNLKNLSGNVSSVRSAMRYKIAGKEQISARLKEVADQLIRESDAARNLQVGLEQILTAYRRTEDGNVDQLPPDKSNIQLNPNGLFRNRDNPNELFGSLSDLLESSLLRDILSRLLPKGLFPSNFPWASFLQGLLPSMDTPLAPLSGFAGLAALLETVGKPSMEFADDGALIGCLFKGVPQDWDVGSGSDVFGTPLGLGDSVLNSFRDYCAKYGSGDSYENGNWGDIYGWITQGNPLNSDSDDGWKSLVEWATDRMKEHLNLLGSGGCVRTSWDDYEVAKEAAECLADFVTSRWEPWFGAGNSSGGDGGAFSGGGSGGGGGGAYGGDGGAFSGGGSSGGGGGAYGGDGGAFSDGGSGGGGGGAYGGDGGAFSGGGGSGGGGGGAYGGDGGAFSGGGSSGGGGGGMGSW